MVNRHSLSRQQQFLCIALQQHALASRHINDQCIGFSIMKDGDREGDARKGGDNQEPEETDNGPIDVLRCVCFRGCKWVHSLLWVRSYQSPTYSSSATGCASEGIQDMISRR